MFELTCQFASMEPPPDETAQLFAAIAADPRASEDFVSMLAGTMAVADIFDPDNVHRYMSEPIV